VVEPNEGDRKTRKVVAGDGLFLLAKFSSYSQWTRIKTEMQIRIYKSYVYRKSEKILTQRRKVNELIIFAPLRDKFHAAIFLLLRVCIGLAVAFTE